MNASQLKELLIQTLQHERGASRCMKRLSVAPSTLA